ncbi:MAG TPA: hypothetical protein DCP90_08515 [Clostridiales bacterium]|nr:MAG: hypothetical protein A2Y22_05910 [Clostridiales bacterium GWD2_32_59]HAN10636.1 hypothetical protein [Clostridiales bacterium]
MTLNWQERLKQLKTFYRKMSTYEASKILADGHIDAQPKENAEKFKYFSNSLIKAIRFNNRYINIDPNKESIIKFIINETYIDKLLRTLVFNANDPYGKSTHLADDVAKYNFPAVYNYAHKDIWDLIDIGLSNAEILRFNKNIKSIQILEDHDFNSELENNICVNRQLIELKKESLEKNQFFVAYPFDLALLSHETQFLSTEGLSQKMVRYISKNPDLLKDISSYESILIATLCDNSTFQIPENNQIFELNRNMILKLNKHLAGIAINTCSCTDKLKDTIKSKKYYKDIMHTNEQKNLDLSAIKPLSKETIKIIEKLLSSGENVDINDFLGYIPLLVNAQNFIQLSPIHRFDVADHIIATVNSLDTAIEFMKTHGIEIEFTPNELMELRWTLLLHDIAKPYCESKDNIYLQFPMHEEKSAIIAQEILQNLDYLNTERILLLIRNHGNLYNTLNEKRFINKLNKLIKSNAESCNEYVECDGIKSKKKLFTNVSDNFIKMFMSVKISDIIGQDLILDEKKLEPVLNIYEFWNSIKINHEQVSYRDLSISVGEIIGMITESSTENLPEYKVGKQGKQVAEIMADHFNCQPEVVEDPELLKMIAQEIITNDYIL